MLKQQNEVPKRVSQHVPSSQSSQTQSFPTVQAKEDIFQLPTSQPSYPNLPTTEVNHAEDDDDDWISQPIPAAAPAPKSSRPILSKSNTAQPRPSPAKPVPSKLISVSNPDLPAVAESTTPIGSPNGRKYMDGPLSASKSKLYSAFRAAKEKLIGSSATSAQAKLDYFF